jgi:hypothetical protein
MSEKAAKNTDRELFREIENDYYSPSIHVTENGSIGINVAGSVIVKSISEWHSLAYENTEPPKKR